MLQLRSRDEELKSIIRYKQNPVCKPMFYTPNVWIHVERVTWLTISLSKQLWFSEELSTKIMRRAMFHDDSEIIAWDYATPEKQSWSREKKEQYDEKCKNAIPLLVEAYQKELGNDYKDILIEMEWKHDEESIIHAIIEYADKLDAFMETFHELYSWSVGFLSNMKDHFHKDMTCWKYILDRVIRRRQKLEELIWDSMTHTWLLNTIELEDLNISKIVHAWEIHSLESVQQKTWFEIYDIWKQLHFKNGTNEHISYLYIQNKT